MDPDRRIQQAIRSVFERFTALGSARQVLLEFRSSQIPLPAFRRDRTRPQVEWRLPTYGSILKVLTNPVYAGAYAFGKTEAKTIVQENGRAKKTVGHRKPMTAWTTLIRDHHDGYISWEQYERNQKTLAENNFMHSGSSRKAGRGGNSLLTGLLRCRRCGRMLHTYYTGRGDLVRYICKGAKVTQGEDICISFAGLRPEQQVANEILRAVEADAVEAAIRAADRARKQQDVRLQAFRLELEQTRYQAALAERRFEAVEPDNRLVAGELEKRWNAALRQVEQLEKALRESEATVESTAVPDRAALLELAHDLESVWHSATTDLRLKQRIVRILIEEIVVDVDQQANEVVLLIHWSGDCHSEIRINKPRSGEHGHRTAVQAVEVVRQMAAYYPDEIIAATLNRLGLETGYGNSWKRHRVCSLRSYHGIPACDPAKQVPHMLTAEQAAEHLGISQRTVRELLRTKVLHGSQIVKFAPWQIPVEALASTSVVERIRRIREGSRERTVEASDACVPRLPGL
jgi:hypothetical protein